MIIYAKKMQFHPGHLRAMQVYLWVCKFTKESRSSATIRRNGHISADSKLRGNACKSCRAWQMLQKISTVARVKLFYVACSKNGFLPWTMENDQRQLLAQFRSTSKSGISSGAFLVVLQKTMIYAFPPHGRDVSLVLIASSKFAKDLPKCVIL